MPAEVEGTAEQLECASNVMREIRNCIRDDRKILLPQRANSGELPLFVPNPFGGEMGGMRYQFEGEEDLLHLIVVRLDGAGISREDSQPLASVLFQGVSDALIWFKPGALSHHYYVGHDDLL